MRTGSDQAGDPPAATQRAGPPHGPPFPATRLVTWHGDLVAWVDRLGWLRSLNDWLAAILVPFRERHQDNLALELMHGGRWAGHPIHPALSDLPIGLWAGATVLDAADRGPAPEGGIDAAGVLSAAGIVAAGATALTGLTDWTVSDDQDRRVGLFHGLLNTVALGLQCASLGSRLAGHRSTARALGAAGLTVTAAAGYLGGHLVFTKGVMVSRVAWAAGPRRWVRALPEADLPEDSPVAVEAEGRQVMLYRHRGNLYAIDNICSHAGGLLSRGAVEDLTVTCPLHGSRFSLADGCVSRGPASQPQPVLRTRIRNGWIEVRGSQPAPRRLSKERTQP
ncbi:MAG TPA: Rieske 2Fe-2S domain-containing protein [Streptosporangiaceae bacterium]|nr:Rieske 2Fe-2S domain-containing protein [Streptosporangiaceae bacterium]